MPLSKIQAESMNLADTYAFTGTVSGAGGLVKLNTTDITSSTATLVYNNTLITDTYSIYIVQFEGLKPSTDNVYFRSRYSTDNGSSFITGTFQLGYVHGRLGTGVHGGSGYTKSNYAENYFSSGNDANFPFTGYFRLSHMRDANTYLSIETDYNIKIYNNNYYVVKEGYILEDASVINYVEFSFASGNIADGTFTLFGVAK